MAVTSRPISADPRARLNAARLAETKVPLPRTAAGRTPMLSAGQLEAVYDRMYSQAEESRLKAQQREREQRRAMREQCTCVRGPEDQSAIIHRLAVKDVGERRTHAQTRAARTARVQAAQQLCNVVALDRDAKTKLHEGRPPAAPRRPAPPGPWRQRAWPCLARRCSTCPTTSGMLSWQATTAAHRPGSGHLPCLNDESILYRSARVVRVSPSPRRRELGLVPHDTVQV